MRKQQIRTETSHDETFRDLATPPSLCDLSLALITEVIPELIASLQTFSGDMEIVHANYWLCGLLRYGSVGRAGPSAFNALFAQRSERVVIDSVSLHFVLTWLGQDWQHGEQARRLRPAHRQSALPLQLMTPRMEQAASQSRHDPYHRLRCSDNSGPAAAVGG